MRELLGQAEALRATPVTTRKDWVRLPPPSAPVTVVTVRLEWNEPARSRGCSTPGRRVPLPA